MGAPVTRLALQLVSRARGNGLAKRAKNVHCDWLPAVAVVGAGRLSGGFGPLACVGLRGEVLAVCRRIVALFSRLAAIAAGIGWSGALWVLGWTIRVRVRGYGHRRRNRRMGISGRGLARRRHLAPHMEHWKQLVSVQGSCQRSPFNLFPLLVSEAVSPGCACGNQDGRFSRKWRGARHHELARRNSEDRMQEFRALQTGLAMHHSKPVEGMELKTSIHRLMQERPSV